jgi:phosphomannomutase/phosphoglucomutase
VGHDARSTSESFHREVIKALTESGIDVVDVGLVTTPMSYWAQFRFKVKGLVMITASHNPVGWNGLKLGTDLARTLLPNSIKELYGIITAEKYFFGTIPGKVRKETVTEAYFTDLVSRAKLGKKFKILVNTGNGTAGAYAPELLRRFGCEVVEHYTNIDPTYPHYTPNPDGTTMMEDTGKQVIANGCDIGLAFDGDGDRLGVTDEKGATVWPDRYLALLARLVLMKEPGAKIVFDVKVSEALPEDIAAHGGVPIMWKTGHSYIKSKIAEEKAPLGGEMSGHIFFLQGYYGFDDAFFAALKLLEFVSHAGTTVSALVADTPSYVSTPTIQLGTTEEDKYGIVDTLTAEFKAEGYRVFDVNGARVYFPEGGWGLVRASSNIPSLVLRFEAGDKEHLDKIQEVFKQKLARFPSVSKDWNSTGH